MRYVLSKRQGRERFVPRAKDVVEDPFEVWLTPFRKADGSVVMRKRYIGLYASGAGGDEMLVVVERYREGYGVWNAYPRRNIDSQRSGYLLYARDGKIA
jgi:hypothetical protein